MVVALMAVAAGLGLPAAAQAELRFRNCNGIGCARVSVPLDRSGATPGRISLYVESAAPPGGRGKESRCSWPAARASRRRLPTEALARPTATASSPS